ncbi:hypothetical protein LCGC14_1447570 [marine sediment metagenome]|uniref:Uncharacterized protein n=1 Tax=marine sediment metagenome TaxID=412755 RepID=A0A0F9K560_9ZZZZ
MIGYRTAVRITVASAVISAIFIIVGVAAIIEYRRFADLAIPNVECPKGNEYIILPGNNKGYLYTCKPKGFCEKFLNRGWEHCRVKWANDRRG